MKKILITILACVFALAPVASVRAIEGLNVSTGSITMTVGGSATFTVSAPNAAGRLDFRVANSNIARLSAANAFLDQSSETVTVSAVAAGSTTITIYVADMTTYDDVDLTGKSVNIAVTVNPVPTPTPRPNPTPTPTPTPAPTPAPVVDEDEEDEKKDDEEEEDDDIFDDLVEDSAEPDIDPTPVIPNKKADVSDSKFNVERIVLYGIIVFEFLIIVALLCWIAKLKKNRETKAPVAATPKPEKAAKPEDPAKPEKPAKTKLVAKLKGKKAAKGANPTTYEPWMPIGPATEEPAAPAPEQAPKPAPEVSKPQSDDDFDIPEGLSDDFDLSD